jgi:hypothetical protein
MSADEIDPRVLPHKRHPLKTPPFLIIMAVIQVINFLITKRVHFATSSSSVTGHVIRVVSQSADYTFWIMFAITLIMAVVYRGGMPKHEPKLLTAYLSVATLALMGNIAILTFTGDHFNTQSQAALIVDLGLLFSNSTLVFSLWYQLFDHYLLVSAFDFPVDVLDPDAPPRWVDYLFLSFNTMTTFGPTTEGIRRRPVKVVMMIQTTMSLTVLIVLVAKIIKS